MNRPIWFLNMCAVSDWRRPELGGILYWQGHINDFLNRTNVRGDADAEAVVRVCHKLLLRFADFTKLQDDPRGLRTTARRLRGLLTTTKGG